MSFLQSLLSSADGLPSPPPKPLLPFLLLRLPNQSPESAEVASAATSADATDALADREGEEAGRAGMGKIREGVDCDIDGDGWMDVRVESGCMDMVKAKSRSHSRLASSLADFPMGASIAYIRPSLSHRSSPGIFANFCAMFISLSRGRRVLFDLRHERAAPARNADVSLMMSPPI